MITHLAADVLDSFTRLTGLPITKVTRTGHERQLARYELTLDDGRTLRIGDETLWSYTEFAKESAVNLGKRVHRCKPATWQTAIEALVIHATELVDTPGESFEDTVLDWLRAYTQTASTDRSEAAAAGAPFIDDGQIHIKASHFAINIRREYLEQVRLHDLRQALRDIGFTQHTVNYQKRNTTWSTASYYRGPLPLIYRENDTSTTIDKSS